MIDIGRAKYKGSIRKRVIFHCVKCDLDVEVMLHAGNMIDVALTREEGYLVGVECPVCGLPHMKLVKDDKWIRGKRMGSNSSIEEKATAFCIYCGQLLKDGICNSCGGPNGDQQL